MASNTAEEKQLLRQRARERRAALARACPDFAERVAPLAETLPIGHTAEVSGYRALPGEADPSRLLEALAAKGCEISYPRVHRKAEALWFHVPAGQELWVPGAYGIFEPRSDWPRAFPSVLLVPLLAFDADGYRLGYGGGYYDRTLAQFRAERPTIAIGIAYAGQEVPRIPRDGRDQRLDSMVTEQGIRRFGEQ